MWAVSASSPEWGEIDGSIVGPGMDLVWSGEATPADQVPACVSRSTPSFAENGYPKP